MINTDKHGFNVPEQNDFILDTIDHLAENFRKLDGLIEEKTSYLNSFLIEGVLYDRGKKVWNQLPDINEPIGWVNIRTGLHAPTWQERTTYKVADLVITQSNNGHVYECIEGGVSGVTQPQFPTTTNRTVNDYNGATPWVASRVYEVDDIVIAKTGGNTSYHYRCISRGTSSAIEPNWSLSSGVTITDGGVVWQTYKTAVWREVGTSSEFRAFGIIQ